MKERAPGTEVIVISGQGTIARALDAGQAGAFFFVEKSQLDPDGLVGILERAGRQVDERVTHEELRAKLRDPDGMGAVVGQSQVMRELFELVDARGAEQRQRAHPGRERHRQGAHRQRAPPAQPARRRARSSRSTARRFRRT